MATGSESSKKNNTLHVWGNERTMNINHLILTNIVTSNYFKNDLQKLKTFHEIVDEIYNQVSKLYITIILSHLSTEILLC